MQRLNLVLDANASSSKHIAYVPLWLRCWAQLCKDSPYLTRGTGRGKKVRGSSVLCHADIERLRAILSPTKGHVGTYILLVGIVTAPQLVSARTQLLYHWMLSAR